MLMETPIVGFGQPFRKPLFVPFAHEKDRVNVWGSYVYFKT